MSDEKDYTVVYEGPERRGKHAVMLAVLEVRVALLEKIIFGVVAVGGSLVISAIMYLVLKR